MHGARAALVRARDLQIEEWELLFQPLEVRLERARLDLDARDLPEAPAVGGGVAEERGDRPAAREPGDAMLGIGLPEPVGRELGQAFQALLVRPHRGELALAPAGEHCHHQIDGAAGNRRNEQ